MVLRWFVELEGAAADVVCGCKSTAAFGPVLHREYDNIKKEKATSFEGYANLITLPKKVI